MTPEVLQTDRDHINTLLSNYQQRTTRNSVVADITKPCGCFSMLPPSFPRRSQQAEFIFKEIIDYILQKVESLHGKLPQTTGFCRTPPTFLNQEAKASLTVFGPI